MTTTRKPRARLNALTFALILRELQHGACSASDLIAVIGYGRHTVVSWLRTMHGKGCIRIVGYECDNLGRQRSAVYALGEGADVARKQPNRHDVTNAKRRERNALRLVERMAA